MALAAVLPTVAAVTIPVAVDAPVPVVNFVFWIRPRRSPSIAPIAWTRLIGESRSSSYETSTSSELNLYAFQVFAANDRRFYPLWERAQELGLICLFHSGTTGVGAGQPGGGGIKLESMKPIPYIDDIAADFPSHIKAYGAADQ